MSDFLIEYQATVAVTKPVKTEWFADEFDGDENDLDALTEWLADHTDWLEEFDGHHITDVKWIDDARPVS